MVAAITSLTDYAPRFGAENMITRCLRQPGGPPLEFIEARPKGEPVGAPVLFLHGAFCGAWSWSEIFLPFFARRGRHVGALSLRGHNTGGNLYRLSTATLSDYLADARRAFGEFSEPPVVIGHSLGGLLAQMLIGRVEMRALILLASLPPEGLFLESPRLIVTDPHIWLEAVTAAAGLARQPMALAAAELLFSEGLPREHVRRYAAMMTPEAPRALFEAHFPGPVPSAFFFGVPTLVVGGTRDRLISQASTWRTAVYHGAQHEIANGQGHFPMLDPGAETVARNILDWLERRSV
jgi:pimeloyl-ACP methyl ester carboxylesterase